jgi:phosphatidylethanolamine/phosphatidyl-N-methylethanolamine N-methyltransferase
MDLPSVLRAYRRYAPVYDFLFGPVFAEGRRVAAERLSECPGGRILEIGVGTGLSFRYYKPDVEIIGIDVSPDMLDVARRRTRKGRFQHVKDLVVMDAQELDFPDNSVDGAVAMYVASVVPDPKQMISEMFRVARPGAPVMFVNHFTSKRNGLRKIETILSPFANRLGFHPDFPLDQFIETVGAEPESVESINFGGYWKVVTFRKGAGNPIGSRPAGKHSQNGAHSSNGHGNGVNGGKGDIV